MDNHQSGDAQWNYPLLGDPVPARSDNKVMLLTIGGICTIGHWDDKGFYKAWSPLLKEDKEKEARWKVAASLQGRRLKIDKPTLVS